MHFYGARNPCCEKYATSNLSKVQTDSKILKFHDTQLARFASLMFEFVVLDEMPN